MTNICQIQMQLELEAAWMRYDLNELDINKACPPFNLIFLRENVSSGMGEPKVYEVWSFHLKCL